MKSPNVIILSILERQSALLLHSGHTGYLCTELGDFVFYFEFCSTYTLQ